MTNKQEDFSMNTSDEGNDVKMMSSCEDDELPRMDPISEGEDSSMESSVSSSSCHPERACKRLRSGIPKKRVSWNQIQTREYALVVGDHPLCQDGLPVSLDWKYSDHTADSLTKSPKLSERKQQYVFPRRLSYEERKRRLFVVSGMSDEQVKNDEIDLVVRTLKESWDEVRVEPEPIDPLSDMMVWDDIIANDVDVDLGDITDFEWTD